MYRILFSGLFLILMIPLIAAQPPTERKIISKSMVVETEENVDEPPMDILLGKKYGYWKVFGKRVPSNIRYLTDSDIIALIIIFCTMLFILVWMISAIISRDSYMNGYFRGTYSKIVDVAKMQYNRAENVVIAYLPEDVWDDVLSEYQSIAGIESVYIC